MINPSPFQDLTTANHSLAVTYCVSFSGTAHLKSLNFLGDQRADPHLLGHLALWPLWPSLIRAGIVSGSSGYSLGQPWPKKGPKSKDVPIYKMNWNHNLTKS